MSLSPDGDHTRVLLAEAGEFTCAISTAAVIETMRAMPTAALPGTPSHVVGVSIVRGSPAPVIDLGALLKPSNTATARARLVSLRIGDRVALLAVDRVVGVRSIDTSLFSEMLSLLQMRNESPLASLSYLAKELVLLLDESRIVTPEVFDQMKAAL